MSRTMARPDHAPDAWPPDWCPACRRAVPEEHAQMERVGYCAECEAEMIREHEAISKAMELEWLLEDAVLEIGH